MTERPSPNSKPKKSGSTRAEGEDRFPTKEELLHELRFHGAKPPPPRAIPVVGRRTRDYLLLAGIGSLLITVLSFRVLSGSEASVVWRLVLTGVASWCGLLWFIFYGVMSRY